MEKFDLEALMASLDSAGLDRLVMVNTAAVEIAEDDLLLMLEQARMIYESELDTKLVAVAHKCDDGATFYVAIVNEGEMLCVL